MSHLLYDYLWKRLNHKESQVPNINPLVGNNTVIHKSRVETVGTHFACVFACVCVCMCVCVCVCVTFVC
jgi:hypothetical protein